MTDWIVGIYLIGLFLLFLEIFFIPGFGFFGISGLVLLLAAIFMIGKHKGPEWGAGAFLLSGILIAALFYLFFRSPASKLLVAKDHFENQSERKPETDLQIGSVGTAITPLYPIGKALFMIHGKEHPIDVSTSGEFLDKGLEIQITRIDGNRIFVKRLES